MSQLRPYGIQTEDSNYRLHIAFGSGKAYLFATESGLCALRRIEQEPGRYRRFAAKQPGVSYITGIGYRIPWRDIEDCQEIDLPLDMLWAVNCQETDLPQMKGQKAMAIALEMDKRGWLSSSEIREAMDYPTQIRGVDLLSRSGLRIQVKCDFRAATLGLALQTAEANPLNRH